MEHDYVHTFESRVRSRVGPLSSDPRAEKEASSATTLPQLIETEVEHLSCISFQSGSQVMHDLEHFEVPFLAIFEHLMINSLNRLTDDLHRDSIGKIVSKRLHVQLVVNQLTLLLRAALVRELSSTYCVPNDSFASFI